MKASIGFRVLLGLVLAATTMTMTALAQDQDNAQALADRWTQAYNKHDRDALGALYADNARVMIHGTPSVSGRRAIEEYWAADFEDRNPSTLLTVTHSIQGADMTLVHGNYQVINRDDGKQLGSGRFAHIWRQSPGGTWQLDRDLWNESFDPYASATNPAEPDVQMLAERWVQAYNKHDRDALGSLYTDDAELMLHGTPTIVGRANIGEYWAEDFKEGNPLTLLTVTHALEGVDMILVHGNYQVIDRADGSRLGFGRFSHIWTGQRAGPQDSNGAWHLDRDLWYQPSEP